MAVRPPEMLAAPPRTLLALDLVGPVEAEPAQLVGHLRSGVGVPSRPATRARRLRLVSRDGVDQRCITWQMVWLLALGEVSASEAATSRPRWE